MKYNEDMKDQLISLTKNLIGFRTTQDNYEEKKRVIDFVREEFEGYKVYITELRSRKSPSIVITLRREKTPTILLNGHLDVVAAEDSQFIPRIKGNRLYARGAGDMKGSCAAMIEAMKYFSKQEEKLSLGLMLTTDEEIGGHHGVGVLVGRFKPSFVIIPDGGRNLKTIILNQKGLIHFKIWTHGKSSHGSRPFLGENAIEKIIDIYRKIELLIPESKKEDWDNTVNLGRINGGDVVNRVPHYAEAYFDVRFINSYEREKIMEGIRSITKNYKIMVVGNACNQEPIDFIEQYKAVAEKVLGSEVIYSRVEGASDARFFAEKGIPVLITNIKSDNIHAKNEWIDIRQMESFYDILIRFIPKFLATHNK
ncbi:MAG: M20/M25/M40 family metallo-hydrolase [Candidatus Pacebacteria bacterium]|nr:M20/M25/M40 family metallo-hydrolase [Candidatus Paceibacterota bacterium]